MQYKMIFCNYEAVELISETISARNDNISEHVSPFVAFAFKTFIFSIEQESFIKTSSLL